MPKEIFYGYEAVFEVANVNIFQFIKDHTDDFLWDRGFRPAFTEEKYIKHDEKTRIILTPTSKFTVTIEPQKQRDAENQLRNIRSLIKEIANFVAQGGELKLNESIKYVLLFYQALELKTLLPRWYVSVVDLSRTTLREFKTFIEEINGDMVRITEVSLSTKEENNLEIKIVSPDLDLAKELARSICESASEG